MHMGIDLGLRIGAPVYAAFDGKVRYAKFNTGGLWKFSRSQTL